MPGSKTLMNRDTTFISYNMTHAALVKALRKHGLTATKVIIPIVKGLEATKLEIHKEKVKGENGDEYEQAFAEEVPDWPTRLKAAQMGINLLGLTKAAQTSSKQPTMDNKDLVKALNEADEVKLQEIVFKQNKTANN